MAVALEITTGRKRRIANGARPSQHQIDSPPTTSYFSIYFCFYLLPTTFVQITPSTGCSILLSNVLEHFHLIFSPPPPYAFPSPL